MPDSVFVLWHVHNTGSDQDAKLIGVYKSREDATSAIWRLIDKPGFNAAPHDFKID
jgi:hypothetical protein